MGTYKSRISKKEVLKRYKENFPYDESIVEILEKSIILCNRAIDFEKRYNEKMNQIIKPIKKAMGVIKGLEGLKWRAGLNRLEALQLLGIIVHDLIEVTNGTKEIDYNPYILGFDKEGSLGITPTKLEDELYPNGIRNLYEEYESIIYKSKTSFTIKAVLKIATVCILEILKNKQGISGRKSDDAKIIIRECFQINGIGITGIRINAIQDDDNNVILRIPQSYISKHPKSFKSNNIIHIKNNQIN